ncbi:acyl carrier protein [Lentzea sp. NPDC004789]
MSADTLRPWLTGRVAAYLDRAPDEVDTARPLAEYGLDSLTAVALCADIEDEYGIEADPMLAWDHPSIDALAGVVATLIEEKARR